MKKALLIEFDINTGKRAGNISPRDPNLPCRGWQNLESKPAREIRLAEDNRDLSQYEGIEGITILNGEAEINQAIEDITPELYSIQNETLFLEHLRQRHINLDDYQDKTQQTVLRELHKKGIMGITKTHRKLL